MFFNVYLSVCRSLSEAKESLVLLSSEEGDHGVGSNTEVVGGETGPEAEDTLTSNRLLQAVHDGLVGKDTIGTSLLLLNLCLNIVEGEGGARGGDTREHGSGNLDLEGGPLRQAGGHAFSHSIVGDEHGHVEGGGSSHGGHSSLPEGRDTFLSSGTL